MQADCCNAKLSQLSYTVNDTAIGFSSLFVACNRCCTCLLRQPAELVAYCILLPLVKHAILGPAAAVQGIWKDGSFAEKMLCPAECCTIIPETRDLASHSPAQWSALCWLAVSYGGLVRGDVQAGSTVVVNGATGGLGSLAVLLALSMGVAKV